ncbi:precorrin-6A/cobalt-precorrin-6A reductase [Sinobacterium caligoides]|uniref:Precorrin-6A/cobalt-precorrin-6A reductase n=1 Tax=Sinobacterium caligoides TaxID=933926 RepID=A0A3N2DYG5_9GAMM|nr:precorrin-6A/cobalt-precorrin-6A reductase [Sinobacterium caligoides]ROS04893.1 precorrin-6A/cobalt-precorrin-6A reductase [Sinobacterium caligoides]
MRLLLLGGTTEARRMAMRLTSSNVTVIYSVAGLVRQPSLPCQVISGGFSCRGGLSSYLKLQAIDVVLDATHPYANNITQAASQSCDALKIPYVQFLRAPWHPGEGDLWYEFPDWSSLQDQIPVDARVFFSSGQLPNIMREAIENNKAGQSQLLRTAVLPQHRLAKSLRWVKAIGPFTLSDEMQLLRQERISLVVSKNSGGEFTRAKLVAARSLNIPVYMLARPSPIVVGKTFGEVDGCVEFLERMAS